MTISPSLAALGGAGVVALVVAFVIRPAQLAVHVPEPEPSIAHDAVPFVRPTRAQSVVYVAGAVVHPGVYAVPPDARAVDALTKAGGATRDADLVAVNLAAHVADGDEIAVPHLGEARAPAGARSTGRRRAANGSHRRHRRTPRAETAAADPGAPLDLNTADEAALAELPGIGPTLAQRIVEFRDANGPFASVDGLGDVSGITPQRLDALEPMLTTGR